MSPENQTEEYSQLRVVIQSLRQQASLRNQRTVIVLSGDSDWCDESARHIVDIDADCDVEWVGKDQDTRQTQQQHFSAKLGREVDVLIFPLTPDFDANRLTALSGMIRGGGLLVFQLTRDLWNSASHFDQRLIHNLHQPGIHWLMQNKTFKIDITESLRQGNDEQSRTDELYLKEQNDLVDSLVQLCQAGDKATVIIQSDRGRGKSAALGLAAAKWLAAGESVYLTGPSLKSVDQVFFHAQQGLPEAELSRGLLSYQGHQLKFVPPDAVQSEDNNIQRLLVDEAAAIPIPKLTAWLQQIPQIVFSTTIHGYEGTGKGFLLKFSKILDQQRPGWKIFQLQQPIRWASDDLLEKWLNSTFLLGADIETLDPTNLKILDSHHLTETGIDKTLAAEFIDSGFCLDPEGKAHKMKPEGVLCGDTSIQHYSSYDLYNDEQLLQQVYGLLINAHYRTTPKDLRYLLDTESASIYCLRLGPQLLAAAWLMYEGDFNQDLSDAVYLGIRRPQGHLLAQSLTYHCAIQDAATYRYARIVRIAVHPQCQRQGLGSQLLQHIIQAETEVDAIGTSFSATPEGLDFWQQNDFIPVRIGMSRHQASGEHSVMLLHSVSEAGQAITDKARNRMLDALPYHLLEPLADMDRELVMRLADSEMDVNDDLAEDDWQELVLFGYANRTYAEALGPLVKLANFIKHDGREGLLTDVQKKVMTEKVLQHKSWKEVAASSELDGQKQVLQVMRETMKILLNNNSHQLATRIAWINQQILERG